MAIGVMMCYLHHCESPMMSLSFVMSPTMSHGMSLTNSTSDLTMNSMSYGMNLTSSTLMSYDKSSMSSMSVTTMLCYLGCSMSYYWLLFPTSEWCLCYHPDGSCYYRYCC